MSELDNVEIMIDRVFENEPQSTLVVKENNKIIAIIYKVEWESDRFKHIHEKCRQYKPPHFYGMADNPIVGTIVRIDLSECERIDSGEVIRA